LQHGGLAAIGLVQGHPAAIPERRRTARVNAGYRCTGAPAAPGAPRLLSSRSVPRPGARVSGWLGIGGRGRFAVGLVTGASTVTWTSSRSWRIVSGSPRSSS
jgi:hypothetical protein